MRERETECHERKGVKVPWLKQVRVPWEKGSQNVMRERELECHEGKGDRVPALRIGRQSDVIVLSRIWSFYYFELNYHFLIRLLSKVAGKGNTAEISSLLFWEIITWHCCLQKTQFYEKYITSLTWTVTFSKIWRAILVELQAPWPSLNSSPTLTSPSNNHTFLETPPSKGHVLYLIGEVKSSSPSFNYHYAYLKSFNRTPKGKQPI